MQRSLGEFAPDLADLNTDTLDIASNVFPRANSYGPVNGVLALSVDALPLPCRGIWFVQKNSGAYDTYLATAEKIYRYNPDTLGFDDVSRLAGGNYGLPSDDFWSGTQFGNQLILCQLGDVPQVIDIDIGTNFDALGGSPPIARFVTVMDDKVILSCLSSNPRMIAWSDINDSAEWSNGLAGNQEFVDHGAVQAFLPHSRLILLERGMHSIVSTGDIYSFAFPELTSERGTTAPYGVTELGSVAYWPSEDGIYAGNSDVQQNISDQKVTQYFYSNINRERYFQIYATYDPFNPRIYFAFPTADTEYNDRVLVYDYSLQRFSELMINTYVLARLATAATTLEGGSDASSIDAPGLPSFDSRIYMAGAPVLSLVGTDLMLSTLAGPSLEATLQPGLYEFDENYRVRVRSVSLRLKGAAAATTTLKIAKLSTLAEDPIFGSAISPQASGRYPLNHDGAFHQVQFTIPANTTWTHVMGWNVDFARTSSR